MVAGFGSNQKKREKRQKFKISKIAIHTSANDHSIVVRRCSVFGVFKVSERNNANFQPTRYENDNENGRDFWISALRRFGF